jgi:hypothetical protein
VYQIIDWELSRSKNLYTKLDYIDTDIKMRLPKVKVYQDLFKKQVAKNYKLWQIITENSGGFRKSTNSKYQLFDFWLA